MATKSAEELRENRASKRRKLTRASIIAETADAIRRDGEDDLSLDDVAAELGLTKPALYYYFKTREGLLLDVFVAEMMNVARFVDDAVQATSSAPDAIEAFVRALVEYHEASPEMSRFLRHRPSAMKPDPENGDFDVTRLYPVTETIFGAIVARFQAAKSSGKTGVKAPRRLAFLVFTSTTGLLGAKDILDPPSYGELVNDLIAMLQARLHPEE